MILDLPSTTSSAINKKMIEMREKGGANAQGRVLTLVIVTEEDASEDPIAAANGASFEHPCRVIVVAKGSRRGTARLDAQIRVGGDAGASEVIVLRLYGPLAEHGAAVVIPLLLADAPVVVWWPGESPEVPAQDPIGALAKRRITDSAAVRRPAATLQTRRASYRPGDTDLAWTRLTNWRGLLAAALDQPPHEKITSASVAGASDSVSADLLAGWLALQLRCPVRRIKVDRAGSGLRSVTLTRRSGEISLVRPEGVTATLSVTNQAPRELTLPRRILRDCIAEELRRLDADDVYSEVLSKGLDLVARTATSENASAAAATKAGARNGNTTPAADSSRRKVPPSGTASGKVAVGSAAAGRGSGQTESAAPKRRTLRSVAKATSAPDPLAEAAAVPFAKAAPVGKAAPAGKAVPAGKAAPVAKATAAAPASAAKAASAAPRRARAGKKAE